MTHKVEIEFPGSYEGSGPALMPIGRLSLGCHVGRLFFCPDGKVRIALPKSALADGTVIVLDDMRDGSEPILYGFGRGS